ncbi:MAG: MSMEG_4193 family putative phosphomutase [Actinomycetota bacterium]
MLLFLIRHAETPITGVRLAGWRPGVHLSEQGRKQAEGLIERFNDVALNAIYSSPLERTVETAQPLAHARKMRIKTRDQLGEVRYGQWEYKPLKVLAKSSHWRTIISHPSEGRFPGGEALRETQARVVAAIANIADQHPKESIAVFTHADVVKMIVAHYAGIHLDLYARLAIAPASVSALWIGDGAPRIITVNETGSLSSLVPRRVAEKSRLPKTGRSK